MSEQSLQTALKVASGTPVPRSEIAAAIAGLANDVSGTDTGLFVCAADKGMENRIRAILAPDASLGDVEANKTHRKLVAAFADETSRRQFLKTVLAQLVGSL